MFARREREEIVAESLLSAKPFPPCRRDEETGRRPCVAAFCPPRTFLTSLNEVRQSVRCSLLENVITERVFRFLSLQF